MKKKIVKILFIIDIEKWLWKSELRYFWPSKCKRTQGLEFFYMHHVGVGAKFIHPWTQLCWAVQLRSRYCTSGKYADNLRTQYDTRTQFFSDASNKETSSVYYYISAMLIFNLVRYLEKHLLYLLISKWPSALQCNLEIFQYVL